MKSNQIASNGSIWQSTIAVDNAHSSTEGLDCGPNLGGLNQVYGTN